MKKFILFLACLLVFASCTTHTPAPVVESVDSIMTVVDSLSVDSIASVDSLVVDSIL